MKRTKKFLIKWSGKIEKTLLQRKFLALFIGLLVGIVQWGYYGLALIDIPIVTLFVTYFVLYVLTRETDWMWLVWGVALNYLICFALINMGKLGSLDKAFALAMVYIQVALIWAVVGLVVRMLHEFLKPSS